MVDFQGSIDAQLFALAQGAAHCAETGCSMRLGNGPPTGTENWQVIWGPVATDMSTLCMISRNATGAFAVVVACGETTNAPDPARQEIAFPSAGKEARVAPHPASAATAIIDSVEPETGIRFMEAFYHTPPQIYVAGQRMGGAAAEVIYATLLELPDIASRRCALRSFDAPRAGNEPFLSYISAQDCVRYRGGPTDLV